jgi:ribosome-associated protein
LVSNGDIKRNNVVELRKRAKIRRGETIEVLGQVINIE